MSEQWRPVTDFEGIYEVSDDGRVRRIATGHTLKGGLDSHGYKHVALHCNGRRVTRMVHVIVAAAFHGPRPDGMETRHLDGDKTNNHAANLAYGTRSENVRDQVAHGTHFEAAKTHCAQGHPYSDENTSIRNRVRNGRPRTERRCLACKRADSARRAQEQQVA